MKLLRVGPDGAEKPALLDAAGKLRDLSAHVKDIDAEALSPAGLAKLAALDPNSLPLIDGSPRIGACVVRPMNIVCIGLNYADHAAEAGAKLPNEPILFMKASSAYCGPYDDVMIPRKSVKCDWEIELGVVIGSKTRYVSEDEALDHVAGYCVINDVSEREFQIERAGTWSKGKSCDTFGPTGPWMVTKDEVPDPQNLGLWCEVDGHRYQNGNTRTMVFGVKHLVSYCSQFMTLYPGDLIATGTPAGVGLGIKPEPVYLKVGQVMRAGVDGLGVQEQRMVAA